MSTGMRLSAHSMRRRPASASLGSAILKSDIARNATFAPARSQACAWPVDDKVRIRPHMYSSLAQEWSAQWPLPVMAVAVLAIFFGLRFVVAPAERGRIKAGIFFSGAYLAALLALALLR